MIREFCSHLVGGGIVVQFPVRQSLSYTLCMRRKRVGQIGLVCLTAQHRGIDPQRRELSLHTGIGHLPHETLCRLPVPNE